MTELEIQNQLIQENIEHNLDYALSTGQLMVSKGIFDIFKTPNLIKTVQLISQPQVGKTGTILHALAEIKIYVQEKYPDKKFRIVFVQPADTELKQQLIDRLKKFKFKNPKTNKFECLEDYEGTAEPLIITTADLARRKNEENIKSIQLASKIENWRDNQDVIIFVHDESHRDCGEDGTYDKFFNEQNVYFWGTNEGQVLHNNCEHELYLKISASASSFLRNAKLTKKHPPISLYLEPNPSYVSFNELIANDRIKEGFKIKTKEEIRNFVIKCLCEDFLINEPGCFIVRLGQNKKRSDTESSGIFQKIQQDIEYLEKNKNVLKQILTDTTNLNAMQINTVLDNFGKLKTFLFMAQGKSSPMFKNHGDVFIKDQQEEEIKFKKYDDIKKKNIENKQAELINSILPTNNTLEIGMMRYFLKDHVQNNDFKVLFIVNSFLQGKTLNLDNVKGWFERCSEENAVNDAFTIQSIGRNCGNHNDKKYSYSIWTNPELIERLADHYNSIVVSTDRLTCRISSYDNITDISSTYVKSFSTQAQNKKNFKIQNPNSLNTFEFDVKVCQTKDEAMAAIQNQFQNYQFDLAEISYYVLNETKHVDYLKKFKTKEQQTLNPFVPVDKNSFTLQNFFNRNTYAAKISDQTSKDPIKIINEGKYARFCHTSGATRNFDENFPDGFRYGIIELDKPVANNPEFEKSWIDTMEKDLNHPLYQKQGHFIAYFPREFITIQEKIKNNKVRTLVDVGSIDKKFI